MTLTLDDTDKALLAGAHGQAAALSMRLLVRFAEVVEAPKFIACTRAHIDGCLYHGQASLDFVERMVSLGGKVRVPTTLNVGSMDLIHPELFRGTTELREAGTRLMIAHEELGCVPTYTCAPYQTIFRPVLGEQVAWAESNAIVFCNSVLGARTNRYGDFLDLASALTGRIPYYGLHVTENRRATLILEITGWPDGWGVAGSPLAVAVGHAIGKMCGEEITAITGLPKTLTEDDLKALGAVSASAGAVGMFHAVGLTPEAPTLDAATQGQPARVIARLGPDELLKIVQSLSTVPDGTRLGAVALGTPHFSITEFEALMPLLHGPRPKVDVYINTGRGVHETLVQRGWDRQLAETGITVVVDTCTYVTSVMREIDGAVMTNSGKWAYYAPGNLGIEVAFGTMADCIASARAGKAVRA